MEATDLATANTKSVIHVLHVDDDPSNLEISKQIMKDMDASLEFDCACCVDEAFKKLSTGQYDVVISDYEMPQKDGLQFLSELRKQNNEIPFILFTGKGREDVAVEALNLGADSYINKNGSPETVYCELADSINKTVERKKSRKLLAKSEAKYHALVENSLQGISILQAAPLRLVFANGAMGKILGYSSQELMALSPEGIMGLVFHEDRAVFFRRMENRLRGEPAGACFEFRGVRKDGSIIWLSALANRVDYEGQPAVQGMFLDVNERKKTEEILLESEARYRELANSLPDIVFETDMNGQLVFANERATEISGYSPGELEKGLNIQQFLAPEDREKAKKNIQRLIAGGSYVPAEYTFVRKNGTTFPALITATPCFSKNKVTGLRGLAIDITERKKAEESLKESEEKFRTLSEELPNMIFINKRGRVVYANKKCEEITGYTKEELYSPNFNFLSLCAPEYVDVMSSSYTRHIKDESVPPYEFALVTRDNKRVETIITTKLMDYEGEKAILGIVTDITERRRTEEKVRFEAERLERVMENSQDLIMLTKPDGSVVYVNSALREITGYSETEFVGKILWIVAPEDSDMAKEVFGRILKGENVEFEHRIITKDGQTKWVIHSCSPIIREGKVSELVSTIRDITERKIAEDKLKQTAKDFQLLNEKLRVIGGLTRHDVGNKLSVIGSNEFLLRKRLGDQPELTKFLDSIKTAIETSNKLLEFSHFYEKIGVEEPSKTDVAQCFNQAVALHQNLDAVTVVNECQGLEVMADSLLKQLFYNFIDNSLKHGEKVNEIRLHYVENADRVKLFYEDNGVGIPEANKEKVFQEGFSTGKTTGLGLFLIKRMVEVYGWTIIEEGEHSKGAKFIITIPKLNKSGKENYQTA